jgi:hypothetical protein
MLWRAGKEYSIPGRWYRHTYMDIWAEDMPWRLLTRTMRLWSDHQRGEEKGLIVDPFIWHCRVPNCQLRAHSNLKDQVTMVHNDTIKVRSGRRTDDAGDAWQSRSHFRLPVRSMHYGVYGAGSAVHGGCNGLVVGSGPSYNLRSTAQLFLSGGSSLAVR